MKKLISLLLILALSLSQLAAAADDPSEIPGTTEMPSAGLRFVPPEVYRDVSGQIVTDGAIRLTDGIYYAYWLYCAMTEEELIALYQDSAAAASAPIRELFYVFSIGSGMTFDEMNNLIGNPLRPEYAREIGKAGDTAFYLYMEEPDQEFAASIDSLYQDEYLAVAASVEETAAAFTCYDPVDPNAALAGNKISFTTKDIDGNTVSSDELFAQHEITMVNIWATWCGPCVGELAELQQIHLRLADRDCGVVGLLDDTDLDSARRLIKQNGVTYPVILAPNNLYSVFPIEVYPSTFFVSRDGVILGSPVEGAYVEKYESRIDSLLQK